MALGADEILAAWRSACRYDVLACKPGNVSLESPGHDMEARDFLVSAAVSGPALVADGRALGERLLAAAEATRRAVGCNTNLGILLLATPLVCAAQARSAAASLRERLAAVLAASTLADARHAFAAICCAGPAGLGESAEQDVHAEPTMPLTAIMALAAGRDRVALQYATVHGDVFERCVPLLRAARDRSGSLAWATSMCFLDLLAEYPDSHVARKLGPAVAEAVRARARAVASLIKACENRARRLAILQEFDRELKRGGVNPGTSADLTVAGLLAMHLDTALAANLRGTATAV